MVTTYISTFQTPTQKKKVKLNYEDNGKHDILVIGIFHTTVGGEIVKEVSSFFYPFLSLGAVSTLNFYQFLTPLTLCILLYLVEVPPPPSLHTSKSLNPPLGCSNLLFILLFSKGETVNI